MFVFVQYPNPKLCVIPPNMRWQTADTLLLKIDSGLLLQTSLGQIFWNAMQTLVIELQYISVSRVDLGLEDRGDDRH